MNTPTNANTDLASASCDEKPEWTIGRLLKWTHGYLARHDVEEPRLAAEVLLSRAAKCRRIDLYTRFDEPLGEAALDRFREWTRRAAGKEPIAYLVEEKELTLEPAADVLWWPCFRSSTVPVPWRRTCRPQPLRSQGLMLSGTA